VAVESLDTQQCAGCSIGWLRLRDFFFLLHAWCILEVALVSARSSENR